MDQSPAHKPSLTDLLTIQTSISIFYSYARQTKLGELIDNPNSNISILTPTNKAVMALSRKPHQGTHEQGTMSEAEYDAMTVDNVERWIRAHIIPMSPLSLEEESYDTLLPGKEISISRTGKAANTPSWEDFIIDDMARVVSVSEASNGVLYVIDETIKF